MAVYESIMKQIYEMNHCKLEYKKYSELVNALNNVARECKTESQKHYEKIKGRWADDNDQIYFYNYLMGNAFDSFATIISQRTDEIIRDHNIALKFQDVAVEGITDTDKIKDCIRRMLNALERTTSRSLYSKLLTPVFEDICKQISIYF